MGLQNNRWSLSVIVAKALAKLGGRILDGGLSQVLQCSAVSPQRPLPPLCALVPGPHCQHLLFVEDDLGLLALAWSVGMRARSAWELPSPLGAAPDQ